MKDVIGEVINERKKQDEKWGEQNHDPFKYISILLEEVGEVSKAVIDCHDWKTGKYIRNGLDCYRAELIQVAAVAVAMVESLDRGKWTGGKQ